MDFPAQRERDLTLPHFCIPRRPPQDWMMPTHICVGGLSSDQMLISSGNNLLKHSEMMFYQLPGNPLAQSS